MPESAEVCLAEAEELLAARDRITSALAARVGRVHRSGEARNHGHASTRLWLRSVGGMTIPGAGRLVTMGMELGRLSRVRERFAEGSLAEGIVEAICTATAGLTDEQATTAEAILLELAGSAGAAEVAKAGRYLRAVLDPDGHESDEQADFDRRFFRVRRRRNGGLEGEFYLPVEAAARLQQMLDVYAKPKAEGDDRTPSVRNADAFIAFLENKIATELLVLVTAESLPDDPISNPSATGPGPAPGSFGTGPSDIGPEDDPSPDPGWSSNGTGPWADACATDEFGIDANAACADTTGADAIDVDDPEGPDGEHSAGERPEGDYRHASTPSEAPHGVPRAGCNDRPEAEADGSPTAERDGPPGAGRNGPPRAGWDGPGDSARWGGDAWPGARVNSPPGVWLRGLPGLILATGHLLPVSSVHRLARTSTLVRIVMDAGGQVLDMGRKVRLATPAQRRAVFARYATCWVDGCPLPATMCQIDHAEDWCSGGPTDLKLLGPACQFHNRDRYRHPARYTRRKIGADRWAFTYRNPRTTRRRL
ncbi:HNH endonuclease signature motif containing protein [Microbispora sp. H10670]|uniref:HNH endonuclease signature motif containing protein n=1 Tax=Microbispora sp. H10670 TaxID=2729108 RepID=UPI00160343A3|nr:HNH endonuclease signature motif containing protein [Microbispora sp. H10670]